MPGQVRSSARQRRTTVVKTGIQNENSPPMLEDTCFTTPLNKRVKRSVTPLKPSTKSNEEDLFELVLPIAKAGNQEPAHEVPLLTRFDQAKLLFHRSTPTRIIGRSTERNKIEQFWQSAVNLQQPDRRILYICGTPGTGKTALLDEMLPELNPQDHVRVIKRNCMMFENATDVLFDVNLEILGPQNINESRVACKKNRDVVARAIAAQLKKDKIKTVLILDEVDQLAMVDMDLLSTIFTWATDPACYTSVIGIANSIDLTAKHVPLTLQSFTETLYFVPYQVEDITAILTDRMQRANQLCPSSGSIIQGAAIELCARKIAAIGDLRKALEIMQSAFDLASAEPNCIQVTFMHVVKALERTLPLATKSTALLNASGGNVIDQLNMNSKMILVSLILFQDENPVPAGTRLPYKKPTLQNVYDRYSQLLRTSAGRAGTLMNTVSRDEFLVLLSDLETFSIVTVGKSGSAQSSRKSISTLPDWQGSVIKLSVSDRKALVDCLKQGGITRLFMS